MQIDAFELERFQTAWEREVRFNLTDSGIGALALGELGDLAALRDLRLSYPYTNGSPSLRRLIASLYAGAAPDQVLVTNGSSEAIFVAAWHFLEPGRELVMMVPNWMQASGIAKAFGSRVVPFHLRSDGVRWRIDLEEFARAVSDRTALINVCSPNNPTGATLREEEIDAICEIAARHGTWILSDEIYAGSELTDTPTSSFWGRYDRVLVTGGLSKVYGLAGLRLGWVVGAADKLHTLWTHKDYTTIGPSTLADGLACIALEPQCRDAIVARGRARLRDHYRIVEEWALGQALIQITPPQAGGMVFPKYHLPINSTDFALGLVRAKGVAAVPGDVFGVDRHLRIGFGGDPTLLRSALSSVSEFLAELQAEFGEVAPQH